MITMRKNTELFWILEALLVTPVALFWIGVVSKTLGADSLYAAIVGDPYPFVRTVLITLVCPAAAAWFAYEYLHENPSAGKRGKKERGTKGTRDIAKSIIAVSLATIAIVLIYSFFSSTT